VLVHPSSGSGFLVDADHVTVRGFHIAYGGPENVTGSGIQFEGSHNTFADNYLYLAGVAIGVNAISCRDPDGGSDFNTIENNTIHEADVGIAITAESEAADAINTGNVIRNNTLEQVYQAPIVVEAARGFLVSGNRIDMSNGHCMIIGTGEDYTIVQGHHRIVDNIMGACVGNGISVYAYPGTVLTHNYISGNTIQYCGDDCIALEAGDEAILSNNQVSDNEASFSDICGIALGAYPDGAFGPSVSDNLIADNAVSDNLDGICLKTGADRNQVIRNLAHHQTLNGLVVSGHANRLMGNHAHDNILIGIEVSGDHNTIHNNTAVDNDQYDLADNGTGNKWWNNEYETAYP
jgi:parallel beta-helix repeat protein